MSSITDSEPIEFDVSSSGQNYLNFANTRLLVKAKITRGNGDDITDADHVGGVNLFLHSLFQQVDVSINDVQVSQSTGTYDYRSYTESLLSYGPQAKTSQLTVKLISAVLLVCKAQLSPSVFLAHAKALESGLAKYPIKRVACKTYTIPAGNLDGNHDKLFTCQLPSRLVIGCVDNDAFKGNYVKNPFNFKHFSWSEISLHLDGHTQPVKPLKPNFNNHQYIQACMSLFSGTGKRIPRRRQRYRARRLPQRYALYAFDLSPDLAEEGHFNLAKQGPVRVEVKLEQRSPTP